MPSSSPGPPASSRRRACRLLAAALLLAVGAAPARAERPVTVFAAASLTNALTRIGTLYEERTRQPVRLSFASSATLARQIEAGAPAQIFASANERWMDHLAEAGLIAAATRTSPIANALVLIAPRDSPLGAVTVDETLDLAGLIGDGDRIAVGDPDHVPAGIYAREALENLGLWQAAEARLARTGDVRAALALVERGEAPLGIVYATDAAVSDGVKRLGRFPDAAHTRVSYPFAVVAGEEGAAVASLFAFLLGPQAAQIFREAGFVVR